MTSREPVIAFVIDPYGRRYVAYSMTEAYYIRDTVGGTIEWR